MTTHSETEAGIKASGSCMPKPAGSTWTDEQWEAIRARGRNILVAAAAGSGKTAVLVERIIRRITDERDPVDVDRLLVATFTKAAAGEMRQRIREALEKQLLRNPQSSHLRRQVALIHRASITTLHSFCLEVIQRYFQHIQLDPSFRIANETEAELMRQDILAELLEEHYGRSEEDSPFWQLVDWFGGERGDEALSRLIQQIYDFSRSHPWPEHWLRQTVACFQAEAPPEEGESRNVWQASLVLDVVLELKGIAGLLREAMKLCELPGGPAPYLDNLREDLKGIGELLRAAYGSWSGLYHAFQGAGFGKLKPCRGDDIDKELQEQVKELRERAKKQLNAIREELFQRTPEQFQEELRAMAPLMAKLAEIVIEFGERYRQQKAARGLVDFADLEHYCLQILRSPDSTPERTVPSEAAEDYRRQFVEVLLDEYQDTNMVQEAIVELISRPDPGNRFMVGDVKQSIYRFRLAEPGLFLDKYKAYISGERDSEGQADGIPSDPAAEANRADARPDGIPPGRRIDLSRNFRSRRQIVDGVNFIFKQLMTETVAEMDYDEAAQLVCGASYPDSPNDPSVELVLIDKSGAEEETMPEGGSDDGGADDAKEDREQGEEGRTSLEEEERQAETAQLEARFIAAQIRRLMGEGEEPFQVYDKHAAGTRPIRYRDIVILLRATSQWAPVFMEELRLNGIPAYADLNTGYFTATEVEIMLSLLKVIDNPYQDIPLAAVLRSPIFGFTAEDLARVRLAERHKPYFEAVLAYAAAETDNGSEASHEKENASSAADEAHSAEVASMAAMAETAAAAEDASAADAKRAAVSFDPNLRDRIRQFLSMLRKWQEEARQGSLADLLWTIYRETGFYDFVGGMPGGAQRQANLRALYDRARQYEATSFRGLFRFLRFIERMQDSGADLGTARALGEQEDVVRIMSIHKSKGLEFPVVFVAGLGKSFNQTDLNRPFLMHKQLGFGPRFVDTSLRVSRPTLPMLAIRRRMRMEMLAEELRVLYVALTRPKEKMFLVGTVPSVEKQVRKWARHLECPSWNLPDYELAKARTYLDWIGPAIIRHPQARTLRSWGDLPERTPALMADEPSEWRVSVIQADSFAQAAAAVEVRFADERMEAVAQLEPAPGVASGYAERLASVLGWRDPHAQASSLFSKTSVSELKRLSALRLRSEEEEEAHLLLRPENGRDHSLQLLARRPKFMERRRMNAAERGTVYHAVMQHVPLEPGLTEETVRRTMEDMVERQLMTAEQREEVDAAPVYRFFMHELGQRLLQASRVYREVPFSYGLSAGEVYPGIDGSARDETVLVQGVIDCLFEEDGELVLLDYKTDAVYGNRLQMLTERYRLQLNLYARAIESIWKRPVKEKYLYFFDGSHVVNV